MVVRVHIGAVWAAAYIYTAVIFACHRQASSWVNRMHRVLLICLYGGLNLQVNHLEGEET